MKKYKYNLDNGELEPFEVKSKPDYTCCISLVDDSASTTDLVGTAPLVFSDYKALMKYLSSKEGKRNLLEWLASAGTVVIQQAEIYES